MNTILERPSFWRFTTMAAGTAIQLFFSPLVGVWRVLSPEVASARIGQRPLVRPASPQQEISLSVLDDPFFVTQPTVAAFQRDVEVALDEFAKEGKIASIKPTPSEEKRTRPKKFFARKGAVVRRSDGSYFVKGFSTERASSIHPTQEKAIEHARELDEIPRSDIGRIRDLEAGKPDQWRKP